MNNKELVVAAVKNAFFAWEEHTYTILVDSDTITVHHKNQGALQGALSVIISLNSVYLKTFDYDSGSFSVRVHD